MKKILLLAFTLFSFACSSTEGNSSAQETYMFPKDFGAIKLYGGDLHSVAFVELDTADSNFTFLIEDINDAICSGSFVVSESKINEFRDLVADIRVNSGDGSFDTSFVSHESLEFIVDGKYIFEKGTCDDGTCDTISKTHFCRIQTFLKDLLENSGEDLSTCPYGIYEPNRNFYGQLLNC